jgi:hypothetical protein
MSPTRRTFVKAMVTAPVLAVLPATAFASPRAHLPAIDAEQREMMIPAVVAISLSYIGRSRIESEARLRESLQEPDKQAGLAMAIGWLEAAIAVAKEEMR